jgi:hypothetical protein
VSVRVDAGTSQRSFASARTGFLHCPPPGDRAAAATYLKSRGGTSQKTGRWAISSFLCSTEPRKPRASSQGFARKGHGALHRASRTEEGAAVCAVVRFPPASRELSLKHRLDILARMRAEGRKSGESSGCSCRRRPEPRIVLPHHPGLLSWVRSGPVLNISPCTGGVGQIRGTPTPIGRRTHRPHRLVLQSYTRVERPGAAARAVRRWGLGGEGDVGADGRCACQRRSREGAWKGIVRVRELNHPEVVLGGGCQPFPLQAWKIGS